MAERIALEIALNGAKEVLDILRQIEKYGDKLTAKRFKIDVDKAINDARRAIDGINRDLEDYRQLLRDAARDSEKYTEKEIQDCKEHAEALRDKKKALQEYVNELNHEHKANETALKKEELIADRNAWFDKAEKNMFEDAIKRIGAEKKRLYDSVQNSEKARWESAERHMKYNQEQREKQIQNTLGKMPEYGREGYLNNSKATQGLRNMISQLKSIGGKVGDKQFRGIENSMKHVTQQVKREMLQIDRAIDEISRKFGDSDLGKALVESLKSARREMGFLMEEANQLYGALERTPKVQWGKIYNRWSGNFARLGSSLITAGNTMQRITQPFENVFTGMAYGAGYGILNKVTEGFRSGFERYDIMTKYDRLMKQYEKVDKATGKVTYSTEQSKKALDESVQGLPTGLDEIVQMAQRYTLSTGDMKRGTDLAIASNNAFLASMSTQEQKYQGMLQMQDLLNGKKLQPREWMSLGSSMGTAINEIAKAMGAKTQSEIEEFRQKLYAGKIEAKDFLDALIKVGTGNGKIAKMALESKNTWEAFTSRVGTAFSRMAYGVLKSFDEITKIAFDGKTLNQVLDDLLIPSIDNMTKKAKEWVNAHPQEILDFFNKIRNFDWGGVIKGFGDGIGWLIGWLDKFFDFMEHRDVSGLVRKLIKMNVIGKVISLIGGAVKGGSPLGGLAAMLGEAIKLGGIKGLGKLKNISIVATAMGGIQKVVDVVKKLRGAKAATDAAEEVAEAGKAMGKVPLTWQGVADHALSILEIPAMAGSMLLAAKALQEFDKVNLSWGLAGKITAAMGAIGAFILGAAGIGVGLTSNVIGWFTSLTAAAGGTAIAAAAADMWSVAKGLNELANAKIPSVAKITQVMGAVEDVMNAMNEIDIPESGKNGGSNAKSMADVFDSVVRMLSASQQIAELKVTEDQLQEAEDAIGKLKPHMDNIKNKITELYGDDVITVTPEENKGKGKGHNEKQGATSKVQRKVYNGDALQNASNETGLVGGIVSNVSAFLTNIKAFVDQTKELKDLNVDQAITDVNTYVDKMAEIANAIKTHQSAFESAEDAGKQFESISTAVDSIKKVIDKVNEIKGMGEVDISGSLSGLITDISTGLSGIGDAMSKAEQFSTFANNIKNGVNNLQTINGIEIDFGGFTATVDAAVKVIKDATKKIKSAWDGFKKATDNIKNVSKNISVTVSISGVDTAVSKMYTAAARLRIAYAALKAAMDLTGGGGNGGGNTVYSSKYLYQSTGGYVDGRGRVLYRAGGGDVPVFKPRGTDTVPAMLTPGEYVNRRKSVKHFGTAFFQRLNHLDLEGALRSISTRAANGLGGGNVIHITNDNRQNNAKVNQTIYTNNPNYTFKRANRFVEAL